MSKKKAPDVEEGAYWMDTYGDLVTLLLTFFVLLFAMSNLDKDKWEFFVKAFQGTTTDAKAQFVLIDENAVDSVEPGNDMVSPTGESPVIGTVPETPEEIKSFQDLYMYLTKYVKESGLEGDVEVVQNSDGTIYIQFRNNLFFDGDSAILRPESKPILDVLSRAISSISDKVQAIQAHGHTAQERKDQENSVAFDRTLSGNRASNVIAYIQAKSKELNPQKAINPSKLESVGHGQYLPITPHDGTEGTRQKNRRVELLISEVDGAAPPSLQDVYDEMAGIKKIVPDEPKPDTSDTTDKDDNTKGNTSSDNTESKDTSSQKTDKNAKNSSNTTSKETSSKKK